MGIEPNEEQVAKGAEIAALEAAGELGEANIARGVVGAGALLALEQESGTLPESEPQGVEEQSAEVQPDQPGMTGTEESGTSTPVEDESAEGESTES